MKIHVASKGPSRSCPSIMHWNAKQVSQPVPGVEKAAEDGELSSTGE